MGATVLRLLVSKRIPHHKKAGSVWGTGDKENRICPETGKVQLAFKENVLGGRRGVHAPPPQLHPHGTWTPHNL